MMIVPPVYCEKHNIEYSIHTCNSNIMKEQLAQIFAKKEILENKEEMLIIPTFQRAKCELISYGDEIEEEKERLLLNFFTWAKNIVDKLRSLGYWADLTDPSSGNPIYNRTNFAYYDLEGITRLLNYPQIQVGTCWIVSHPKWNFAAYPATWFTTAPLETVVQTIKDIC